MKLIFLQLALVISLPGFGQTIVDFSMSDCDRGSYPQFTKNRLLVKEYHNDTLFLKLGMVFNYGVEPIPAVELSSDSLFIAFNDTSTSYTICDCCFELDFTLTEIPDTHFVIFYGLSRTSFNDEALYYREVGRVKNKYIFPSYYEIEEALNEKNPNQRNGNGEKIGIWIESSSSDANSPFWISSYELDENNHSKLVWRVHFSADPYARIEEVVTRSSPQNLTSIEGSTYYKMFGIDTIRD